jgi:hypothetical protein
MLSTVANLARAGVLFATLFVTLDAGFCPVVCLYADQAEHGSSAPPSQAASSSACGACACGLVAVDAERSCPLAPVAKPAAESAATLPLLDPAFDIDHPPRLA